MVFFFKVWKGLNMDLEVLRAQVTDHKTTDRWICLKTGQHRIVFGICSDGTVLLCGGGGYTLNNVQAADIVEVLNPVQTTE